MHHIAENSVIEKEEGKKSKQRHFQNVLNVQILNNNINSAWCLISDLWWKCIELAD